MNRPVIVPAASEETIPFFNCEGRVVNLNRKARIEDLVREGIRFCLIPVEDPPSTDPADYTNATQEAPKTQP